MSNVRALKARFESSDNVQESPKNRVVYPKSPVLPRRKNNSGCTKNDNLSAESTNSKSCLSPSVSPRSPGNISLAAPENNGSYSAQPSSRPSPRQPSPIPNLPKGKPSSLPPANPPLPPRTSLIIQPDIQPKVDTPSPSTPVNPPPLPRRPITPTTQFSDIIPPDKSISNGKKRSEIVPPLKSPPSNQPPSNPSPSIPPPSNPPASNPPQSNPAPANSRPVSALTQADEAQVDRPRSGDYYRRGDTLGRRTARKFKQSADPGLVPPVLPRSPSPARSPVRFDSDQKYLEEGESHESDRFGEEISTVATRQTKRRTTRKMKQKRKAPPVPKRKSFYTDNDLVPFAKDPDPAEAPYPTRPRSKFASNTNKKHSTLHPKRNQDKQQRLKQEKQLTYGTPPTVNCNPPPITSNPPPIRSNPPPLPRSAAPDKRSKSLSRLPVKSPSKLSVVIVGVVCVFIAPLHIVDVI